MTAGRPPAGRRPRVAGERRRRDEMVAGRDATLVAPDDAGADAVETTPEAVAAASPQGDAAGPAERTLPSGAAAPGDPADEDDAGTGGDRSRGRRLRPRRRPAVRSGRRPGARTVLATVAVLVVATAAALIWVSIDLHHRRAVDAASRAARTAAVSGVRDFLSYDYRHLDADEKRAQSHLTGKLRTDYASTIDKGVKPTAAKAKVVTTADVALAGVVRASTDRVVVLAFANQTTTNTSIKQPRVDQSRIQVTLVKIGGRWLISELRAL